MTRITSGALLFGIGLGALADGFVLHQLLQWHHLWSSQTPTTTLDGLQANTLADGTFHTAFLLVLLVGAALLAGRRLHRTTLGFVLIGFGIFHVLDQLIFHLALGAHHIREDVANYQLYDWGFFAIGLPVIAAGTAIKRFNRHSAP